MTNFNHAVRRVTLAVYKHYRRPVVVTLFADTISFRLKGTRTSYEMPVNHLFDYVLRTEALRIAREKKARRKKRL